ncbi:MAG TPA: aldehyde dehydrogenase family protein [Nitrospiraceae bacterium]|nr:aldehyde dehydrogenase family protein [Nitrospiraceae bacterium]
MSMVQVHNFLNGAWRTASGTEWMESRNPADPSDVIGTFPQSGIADVEHAVSSANAAQRAWAELGMVRRAEYLLRVAKLMDEDQQALGHLVAREAGKQVNEARADVIEAIHTAQYAFSFGHLGQYGRVLADEVATKRCYDVLEPRGVVVAITPWNFPIALPFWLTGLSLVLGNCVILKPSEYTPMCGARIAGYFEQAGIPPGVFQVIHGTGEAVGAPLVAHSKTHVILFTGSYEVGLRIKQEVAKHADKICTIETGGKNAVLVMDDANLDMAVSAGVLSAFKTAGQRCVTAGRLLVDNRVADRFTDQFVSAAKRVTVGDPMDDRVFYGTMINQQGVEKGRRFNDTARKEGFHVLLDRNDEPPPTPNGYWLKPFVYTGPWRGDSVCLTEEAFSPHVAIVPVRGVEEAVAMYNDTKYGLSGAILTEDYRKAKYAEEHMRCGIFYWNLPCIGAGVRLPFGGVKQSGNLTPSAAGLIPVLTHSKAVTYNLDTSIVMAQGLKAEIR